MRRIQVKAIREVAEALYADYFGTPRLVDPDALRSHLIAISATIPDRKFSDAFLWWEAYRDVPRIGRRTRLGGKQRELLWQVFQAVHQWLAQRQEVTVSGMFRQVTDQIISTGEFPCTFAVVDEA